ncbi:MULTISPECIES: hypothetical protein [unclassified Lebetimonas]|uniref:hypothetical protein n=1 Tax=unclassified Lebetimonas TaxID=2648158 RepID=UPI0004636BF9|nr:MULTISPECIES: hypothetical protein [unclassified Lebetimonas]
MKKNYYTHSVDLKKIEIKNKSREEFVKILEKIEYRGYEVEQLKNGNKIVITKPGGKTVYGRPKKEDFLVFIYNPKESGLWQITHKQIFQDIEEKSQENKKLTIELIDLLERVKNGEEPNEFIEEIDLLKFNTGESPEALLKAYKWIWGQEDVNYPNGEGREMSWKSIEEFREKIKND